MFIVSNRNIILPGPNGEKLRLPKGYMGGVPAWAEKSAYLAALVKDGKVIISAGGKDKDIDAAQKRGRSGRRGGQKDKSSERPEDSTGQEQPEDGAGQEQPEDKPEDGQ